MLDFLAGAWSVVIGVLTVTAAVTASGHAVVYKRDDRAALGWVAVIWMVPMFGAIAYAIFGINRIRRRAIILRAGTERLKTGEFPTSIDDSQLDSILAGDCVHVRALPRLIDSLSRRDTTYGNSIDLLINGDEAYTAMIESINRARSTIALSTYIFDRDRAGMMFVDALGDAVKRGVEVKVLIDDVGARYSWPSVVKALRDGGVHVSRFARTFLPWRLPYMNLRNHRKIMVVDGTIGFAGGMNIRDGNLTDAEGRLGIQDLHFKICGPVVSHLMEVFTEDWIFSAHERLTGSEWFPGPGPAGDVVARGITDGPDEDFERLRWTIHGALATAQKSIRIVTPYFVPDSAMIMALNTAAMKGVAVDIVLPGKNNHALVHWAAAARLWQLLNRGCRVFYSAPPFDHSKIMIVDGVWSLIGSSNWDQRSLRLNFEFDLECYSRDVAGVLSGLVDKRIAGGREITTGTVNDFSLPVRIRNGIARLFSPYL